MRLLSCLTAVVALACLAQPTLAKTADIDPSIVTHEQGIVDLTDDTFYDYIKEHKNVVVLFRDKTCDECAQIQEDIRVSIKKFAPEGANWTFGRLNVHKYHQFLKVLHLQQFPRVRFYFDQEFHTTLHQTPSQIPIERFLNAIAQTTVKPTAIETAEDFAKFNAERLAMYLSFPDYNERTNYFAQTLQKVFPDIPLYTALHHSKYDKELFDTEKPAHKFLLKRAFDDGNREISAHVLFQPEAILNLISAFRYERVRTLDAETFDQIMSHQHGFTIVFDHDYESENVKNVRNLMLSQHYTGLILRSNLKEEGIGAELGHVLGVTEADFPVFLVVRNHLTRFQKYRHQSDFSPAALKQFLDDYIAGKAPEYFKAVKEVAQQPRKPHELVPSTLTQFVKKSQKHVLVFFYKRGQKESHEMRRELHAVVHQLTDENNIIFAQTDASASDYDFINWRELPQLLLYPKDRKDKPIYYKGRIDDGDIVRFLGDELEAYIHRKHASEIKHDWDL